MEEAGDFLEWRAHTVSIESGQCSAEMAICGVDTGQKCNRGGFLIRF
jgi:hypothetical protein